MIVCQDKIFEYKRGEVIKQKRGYYLDQNLVANLEHLKHQVKNKYDGIFAITGNEGTGKTTIAQAIAYYLDPNLKLENIVFSGQELMNRIEKSSKGDVIIYDEAVTSLSTSDASSEMQNTIIKLFTTIRSKGLYIILLLPNPFMLRRYFFIFRTKFLIHTYSTNGVDRGYFKFYSYKRKKLMYLRGYKEWNMNVVSRNFHGRFTNTEGFFLDAELYETKKQEAIKSITQDKKTKEAQLKEQFEDAKLKLKINIEQWKEKYKEKAELKFAKYKQQYTELRQKKKVEVETIKTDFVEQERKKYQEKIKEIEIEYSRLIQYFYMRERDHFNKNSTTEYSQSMFIKLLENNRVTLFPQQKLKNYLKDGSDYLTLSVR